MRMIHSEEYLRKYWDRLMDQPMDDWRINLEGDLDRAMAPVSGLLTGEQNVAVRKVFAKEIAEKAERTLFRMEKMIDEVDSGRASYGFTTQRQEWECRAEMCERYEFNCFQLKVFKEKYGL